MRVKQKIKDILLWSQKYTRTDMFYLAKGGFWWIFGNVCVLVVSFLCTAPGCSAGLKINTHTKSKEDTKTETDYIFYPNLPNTPRYQYLTTCSTTADIEKKKSKFFKFIVGAREEKLRGISLWRGYVRRYHLRVRLRGWCGGHPQFKDPGIGLPGSKRKWKTKKTNQFNYR